MSTAAENDLRSLGLFNTQISDFLAFLNTEFTINHGLTGDEMIRAARQLSMILCSIDALEQTLKPMIKHGVIKKETRVTRLDDDEQVSTTVYKLRKQWPFDEVMDPTANTLVAGNKRINMPPYLKKVPFLAQFFNTHPSASEPVEFWRKFHQLLPGLEGIHSVNFTQVKSALQQKFKTCTGGQGFPRPPVSRAGARSRLSLEQESQLLSVVGVRQTVEEEEGEAPEDRRGPQRWPGGGGGQRGRGYGQ